jgi:hypothetical protein
MKPEATKAIALFGGAAAVVLVVGFGGGGDKLPTSTTTTTSFGVPPAPPPAAPAVGLADGGTLASLRGCIIGLNCGPIAPKHPQQRRSPISQMPPPVSGHVSPNLRWFSVT